MPYLNRIALRPPLAGPKGRVLDSWPQQAGFAPGASRRDVSLSPLTRCDPGRSLSGAATARRARPSGRSACPGGAANWLYSNRVSCCVPGNSPSPSSTRRRRRKPCSIAVDRLRASRFNNGGGLKPSVHGSLEIIAPPRFNGRDDIPLVIPLEIHLIVLMVSVRRPNSEGVTSSPVDLALVLLASVSLYDIKLLVVQ